LLPACGFRLFWLDGGAVPPVLAGPMGACPFCMYELV
jgi:hypothetical protein